MTAEARVACQSVIVGSLPLSRLVWGQVGEVWRQTVAEEGWVDDQIQQGPNQAVLMGAAQSSLEVLMGQLHLTLGGWEVK